MFYDVAYTLVKGEYWEYEEAAASLRADSCISAADVAWEADALSALIRAELGLGE